MARIDKYDPVEISFCWLHLKLGILYVVKTLGKVYFQSRIFQPTFSHHLQFIKFAKKLKIAGDISADIRKQVTKKTLKVF